MPEKGQVMGVTEGLSFLFQVTPALIKVFGFVGKFFTVLCAEIIPSARCSVLKDIGGGVHRTFGLSNCCADFLWGLVQTAGSTSLLSGGNLAT